MHTVGVPPGGEIIKNTILKSHFVDCLKYEILKCYLLPSFFVDIVYTFVDIVYTLPVITSRLSDSLINVMISDLFYFRHYDIYAAEIFDWFYLRR